MSLLPEILNAALQAYISPTVPMMSELAEHLRRHDLAPFSEEITVTLQGLTKSTYECMRDYPGGIAWTEEFTEELRTELKKTWPWLDDESIKRVVSYAGWISWHEGFGKT